MSGFNTETQLKTSSNNNINNNLLPNPNNEEIYVNESAMKRKIEFDKGNPLSFEFCSNRVRTIPFTCQGFTLFLWKKMFNSPFNIIIIILLLFYLIVFLCNMKEIAYLNEEISISFHLIILIIEFIITVFQFISIYLNDREINNQPTKIYNYETRKFMHACWKNICVGQIIKVMKDEVVPADIIILESLDHNHQCYIDYSSINGIFDSFALKKACNDTYAPSMKTIKFNEYVKNIKGSLKYEEPNSNMLSFNGKLKLESNPSASDITEVNFAMRGGTIKNSEWIYGLVVYVGMETKIMQTLKNSDSDIQKQVIIKRDRDIMRVTLKHIQFFLISIYIIILILLLFIELHKSFLCFYSFKSPIGDDHTYLNFYSVDDPRMMDDAVKSVHSPFYEMFLTFVQYALTFHYILPFSWFGLIKIAYVLLAKFIQWDIKILQKPKNKVEIINKNCIADFGQVRYILTDKTGTLTSRKFTLRACSIHGKLYSFDPYDKKDENYIFNIKNNDMTELEIYQELHSNSQYSNQLREFIEYICLCHSVKIIGNVDKGEVNQDDKFRNDKIYGSCFAEERSALKMMCKLGYKVKKTQNTKITIDINGELKDFYAIGMNKYTEERNKMSVLIQSPTNNNESILLCKANDASIFDLCKKGVNENEILKTQIQIKEMMKYGYRVFVFCKRHLNEEETNDFINKYNTAGHYVVKSEEHLVKLAIEHEKEFDFLGVLFFEEKVSNDLKYSITKLNNNGIKVWIASGDKKENVLAVGKNLNIYNSNTIIGDFNDHDKTEDIDMKMSTLLMQFLFPNEKISKMKTRKGVSVEAQNIKGTSKDLTIVLSGNCFTMICEDSRNFQSLATLLSFCTNLLAYSFSPKNKYVLCQMIKLYVSKNSKVLAIGDGFNDFMMLKEADLSIGIRSREILQVRNSCDIIVTKFPQIVDLILVHGTWNFNKLITIALKSFYANFIIIFPMFLHQNSNLIGSAFYIDYPLYLTLNILAINLFTIFSICFDYPIERSIIGLNANIYRENFYDTKKLVFEFGLQFFKAGADSLILYYFFFILENPINEEGENYDQTIVGIAILYTSLLIILFKMMTLKIRAINHLHLLTIILTVVALIGIAFVNSDITIAIIQGMSYFSIVFNSLFIIGICYLYEYFAFTLLNLISQDFIIQVTKMFQRMVGDYSLFKNFQTMYISLSKEPPKTLSKIDKITYPEVLGKIFKRKHNLDPALEGMADVGNEEVANIKIHNYSMRFYDRKLENDFLNYRANHFTRTYLCYLGSILLIWLVDVCMEGFVSDQIITKSLKIAYVVIGPIVLLTSLQKYRKTLFMLHFILIVIIEIICVYVEKGDNDMKICIQPFFIICFPLLFPLHKYSHILYGVFLYLIGIIPSIFLNDFGFAVIKNQTYFLYSNLPLCYHRTVFIIAIVFLLLFVSRQNEIASRVEFLKYQKCQGELKKDNLIMANLVPEFVREKLKTGERGAAHDYETVTIVFCDISDFDSMVAKLIPKDLITQLDELYSVFDRFCSFHGLQKIETVGKTYMAAGGIKECELDYDRMILDTHHAIRSFEFGIDILDVIQKSTLTSGEAIKVKIGIHTGKVIASVVGKHKPQFSLIGDAVNTTARMCSYSLDNCINCSEFAYQNIQSKYKDFVVSNKEVKGKGMMNLYLFNPLKNKKNIGTNMRIPRDASGNYIMKSVSKNSPILVKQPTKHSLRAINANTNAPNSLNNPTNANNHNNISGQTNKRNSMIEHSFLIIEDSFDGLKDIENSNEFKERKKILPVIAKPEEPPQENDFLKNSFLFLNFKESVSKSAFRRFEKQIFLASENMSILVNSCFLIVILVGIYQFSQYALISTQSISLYIAIKSVILIILVGIVYQTKFVIQNYEDVLRWLSFSLFLAFTITIQIQMNFTDEEFLVNITIEEILTIMTVTMNGLLKYYQITLNNTIYIVIFVINCCINTQKHLILKYSLFLIAECVISQMYIFIKYYNSTFDFIMNQKEAQVLVDTEKILFNQMPLHVVQKMKDDIQVVDVLENVTMLFADIVRFTDFSACHEPNEVVKMLCELFNGFDNSSLECSVYKVHTIGDCYVVMGFNGKVSMTERNIYEEAKNVCKMAENMIRIIRNVRKAVNFEQLDMRIGIHTGPVIAGIIGSSVVRYDIFGSDVLIANKMESSGLPGKINISEETKKVLETKELPFSLSFNKIVQIGSVGKELNSYFIETPQYD